MFILDHNFWTRNARKLIKVSKDADFSLVSNKNLSKNFCLVVGPRSGTSRQNWPKTTLLIMSLTKKWNPKPKNFFFNADSKSCWVFGGFWTTPSAIGWESMRVVSQPKYPWFLPDFQVQYIHRLAANVLKILFLHTI